MIALKSKIMFLLITLGLSVVTFLGMQSMTMSNDISIFNLSKDGESEVEINVAASGTSIQDPLRGNIDPDPIIPPAPPEDNHGLIP